MNQDSIPEAPPVNGESSTVQSFGGVSSSRSLVPFLLYAMALVGLLILVVATRGGGNFYSRVQHLDALRVSIQSEDPARQLLDDPGIDIALIESFLYPAPDSHARAASYYNQWRANKEWQLTFEQISLVDVEPIALVTRVLCMTREGRVRIYSDEAKWEKLAGVWYQKEAKEFLLREFDAPLQGKDLP